MCSTLLSVGSTNYTRYALGSRKLFHTCPLLCYGWLSSLLRVGRSMIGPLCSCPFGLLEIVRRSLCGGCGEYLLGWLQCRSCHSSGVQPTQQQLVWSVLQHVYRHTAPCHRIRWWLLSADGSISVSSDIPCQAWPGSIWQRCSVLSQTCLASILMLQWRRYYLMLQWRRY